MTIRLEFIDNIGAIFKLTMEDGDILLDQLGPKELFVSYTTETPLFMALFPNAVVQDDGHIDLGDTKYSIIPYTPPLVVPNSILTYRAKIVLATTDMPSTKDLKY